MQVSRKIVEFFFALLTFISPLTLIGSRFLYFMWLSVWLNVSTLLLISFISFLYLFLRFSYWFIVLDCFSNLQFLLIHFPFIFEKSTNTKATSARFEHFFGISLSRQRGTVVALENGQCDIH